MYKKLIIIICIFLLVGCNNADINNLSLNEIIDTKIDTTNDISNINRKGYKYFLPQEFSVKKDNDFIQELTSNGITYYLNIDVISYYYKNKMSTNHEIDDYEYYEFSKDDNNGYLRIVENNGNFFIELCYNYAIIEVEVKISEIKYAISRSIQILNSIKYNDLVIEKYVIDKDLDTSETIYKIPEPENKNDSKNILEYIEDNARDDSDE